MTLAVHGAVARALQLGQLPAGLPLRAGHPAPCRAAVASPGPVDGVGDGGDDGERQPEPPGDQTIENTTPTMTATMARRCQIAHPRVAGQVGQVAPALADAGRPRASSASSTGVTTSFHAAWAGRPCRAAGSSANRRPVPALSGSGGPVPQRQVGRLRLDRRPSASAAVEPTSGPVAARPRRPNRTGSAGGPLPRPRPARARSPAHPAPVPLAREPNLPTHPAVPHRATVPRRVPPRCDCVPSSAAPMTWFLSFGHAIRYHPPPQRNCLRTQRIASSLRRLCPTPAGFIADIRPDNGQTSGPVWSTIS